MASTGLRRRGGHRPPHPPGDVWRRIRPCVIVLGIVFAAGTWANDDAGAALQRPPETLVQALHARSAALLAGTPLAPAGGTIAARGLIAAFYSRRGHAPVWSSRERRNALLQIVQGSAGHGLDPADYQIDLLRSLADASDREVAPAADRELLYTEALVRLIYHLRFGKADPRALHEGWNFSRTLGAVAPMAALEALVAAEELDAAVAAYAPQLQAYRTLRAALQAHRAMAMQGGWPPLPTGPTLRPGDRDVRVTLLRARLAASRDLAADAPPADASIFDSTLRDAVVAFQQRHDLDPDAAVGRRTLAALQIGLERRIDQIRVNLERLRWVAQDIAGDYLFVNIASFNARLYLDGRLAWASRVVVGRPYRKTPAFRAQMQSLVLNPEWVVPPTILREDVLPAQARDPTYLARHDMRVVDAAGRPIDPATIDWTRYAHGGFPHQIVQAAGPDNPLGRIKFMLPNPYTVYLHDTPSKTLFERRERAFSSGCIRVERPLALAGLLLDDADRWPPAALEAAIAEGRTQDVPVRRKVPVMILYHTAEVTEDGRTAFHPDLYGLDAAVLDALARPFRFDAVDRPPRAIAW